MSEYLVADLNPKDLDKFCSPKLLKQIVALNKKIAGHNEAVANFVTLRSAAEKGDCDPAEAVAVAERLRRDAIGLPAAAIGLIEQRAALRSQLRAEHQEQWTKPKTAEYRQAQQRAEAEALKVFPKNARENDYGGRQQAVARLTEKARGLAQWKPDCLGQWHNDVQDLAAAKLVLAKLFAAL